MCLHVRVCVSGCECAGCVCVCVIVHVCTYVSAGRECACVCACVHVCGRVQGSHFLLQVRSQQSVWMSLLRLQLTDQGAPDGDLMTRSKLFRPNTRITHHA